MDNCTPLELLYLYTRAFQPCFLPSLEMANGSIDVAPVGCHRMNYVTASVGYECGCAGRQGEGGIVYTLLL